MSETAKTLAFMAAGAVALLAAFFVVPSENTFDVNELIGQELNQFEIDAPKRLKIIKYDGDTGTAHEFEVAEEDGLWQIPSKQGYPADATQQMADAATCLMDREILRVAATSANEHAQLGVIDPTSAKLTTDAKSVGTRVIMSDNNNVLTDMIIGKKVKDAEGQYYVRNTNQDVVYVVALDPKKLSTKFDDWIEDDLLKINPFDIRKVTVKDYTAELVGNILQGIGVKWDRRAEMALTYDNSDSKWTAESLKKFDAGTKEFIDYKIGEDEELNEEALNKLRDGLDDLLLVDVERKPAGLSTDLKAGEDFLKNNDAALSLMERGFAPVGKGEDGKTDILSTEGEIVASLQDGVEYVLRFGNLQMKADGEPTSAGGEENDSEAAKKSDDSINRYLFVMARFNEDMIEKPQLEELPELPTDADETEEGEPTSAGGGKPESGEDASDTETGEGETASEAEAGEPASAGGEEKEEIEATASEEEPADSAADAKEKELADIIAARKEIEEENQRRLDEYQNKIKKGKETVAKLNERFGDWYYVISNDVYQQVHLGLDKVVKKKEAKEGDDAATGAATGASGLPNLPFSTAPADQE